MNNVKSPLSRAEQVAIETDGWISGSKACNILLSLHRSELVKKSFALQGRVLREAYAGKKKKKLKILTH